MNTQDYIGKKFKSTMGFVVTVESVLPNYNFGFAAKDAFKCRILGNETCERAIYPLDTFDENFKPCVKVESQPATPKQKPVADATEQKV